MLTSVSSAERESKKAFVSAVEVSDKEENSPNGKTESLQNEESSSSVQNIPSIAVSESPIEHFDSIVSLEKTISNFEENTKSNFIILQKSKNFGDEDFKASGKEKILWKSQNVKGSVDISFSGIPYVIVGRKTLQCHLGKDLNCHKTKKYEEKRCKKKTEDHYFQRQRRIIQNTKKMGCTAEIHIVHIIRFSDFKMSSDEESSRSPIIPKDSDHGSSVSSDFQDEYDELLRYAVVTPKFGPHFLREHQLTAEQTTSDRFPSPREAAQEQIPERPQSSLEDDQRSSERESQRGSSPTNVAENLLPSKPAFQRTFASGMEAFSPVHSDELSLRGSSSSASARSQTELIQVTHLPVSSENMQQVEDLLDRWSRNLKTNVLAELSKWRLTIMEKHQLEMKKQNEKHAEHITHLSNQIDSLQALIQSYETSIHRKDEVISNLTRALEKQKEKTELMRTFSHWRLQQIEGRREDYVCSLADKHYRGMLLKNMWRTWRSVMASNWKDKVEQACQARAEEVCVELSSDYESKVAQLSGALEEARAEVSRLHAERGQFEGSMKKAFMRGVCALNMEAMSMFQGREILAEHADHPPRREDPGSSPSVTFQQVPTTSQHDLPSPIHAPAGTAEQDFRPHFIPSSVSESKDDLSTPVVISATTSGSSMLSTQKLPVTKIITSGQQKAGKTITARVTARSDLAQKITKTGGSITSMGVSPPMSSIVVEKHHPVTQQTISQAIAAKYPRPALHSASSLSGRGAGQSARTSHVHSGVHSIKVVD